MEKNKAIRKEKWASFFKGAAVILVYFLMPILTLAYGGVSDQMFGLVHCVELLVPFALGIYFYKDRYKENLEKLGKELHERPFVFVLKVYGIVILMFVVQSILASTVFKDFPPAENQELINQLVRDNFSLGLYLSITVFGPLTEELIFREILIAQPSKYHNRYIFATISCCIFALMHSTSWMDFLSYLPMSIIFTVVYLRKKENTMWTSVLHILYNSTIMWIMLRYGV